MPQTQQRTREPDRQVHHQHFKVEIQGLTVKLGFFAAVTGFSSQVDVLEYPEGGQNTFVHRLPSRVKQGNVTLKRGVIPERCSRVVPEDRPPGPSR